MSPQDFDDEPGLTRTLIETGDFRAMVAQEAPGLRLLTETELQASLRATLEARPATEVWVFAYGSLIWNPGIRAIERRNARVEGWRRSFCLSVQAGRGSPARPGLALGLEEGGACEGVALRVANYDLERELALLWRREMVAGAYLPRWVPVLDEKGEPFGQAIAFAIDPKGPHYVGSIDNAAKAERLAKASGALGSAADYLFRTCEALRNQGLADLEMEGLATDVHSLMHDSAEPA